jgi:dienelactone hydrolase
VGLGNRPDDEYAVELVRRCYVCLAPAYPLLANYAPDRKQLGYQSGTMKAIWDNHRGLDLLESLPFVQPDRFGSIGHSLGGHNGIFTAAFDQRIKVVVSSCGLDSFADYMDGNIRGWTSDRYMPRLLTRPLNELPFDFHEVIAAIAPRACFISAPKGDTNFKWESVARIQKAAAPVFALHGVADRFHVEHPDCGHVFPREVREIGYALFDRHLR